MLQIRWKKRLQVYIKICMSTPNAGKVTKYLRKAVLSSLIKQIPLIYTLLTYNDALPTRLLCVSENRGLLLKTCKLLVTVSSQFTAVTTNSVTPRPYHKNHLFTPYRYCSNDNPSYVILAILKAILYEWANTGCQTSLYCP